MMRGRCTGMPNPTNEWTLLVYKLPSQPSRLRLQIWRRLQKMGALSLHGSAWVVPAWPELVENMQYVATAIEELGGSCQVFTGLSVLPHGPAQIEQEFRNLADSWIAEIIERLDLIAVRLEGAASLSALERAEEDLKRERIASLRARRLAYFGSSLEAEVDRRFEELRQALDSLHRRRK